MYKWLFGNDQKQKKYWPEQERCIIREFFKDQDKLPLHRRTKIAMISCPCSGCSPGRL